MAKQSVADLVVVEMMPEHLRASHRAAGNWGRYPHNGAERVVMSADDADDACDGDEYDHVVLGADPADYLPEGDTESAEERLARAAAHVSATALADGRWAHYADETGRWHIVDAGELEELCDYLDDDDEQVRHDAYSHWCAGTSAEEMPRGWEPGDEVAQ